MAVVPFRSFLARAALVAALTTCAVEAAAATPADSGSDRPLGILFDPGARQAPQPAPAPQPVVPAAPVYVPPAPVPAAAGSTADRPLGLLFVAPPAPAARPVPPTPRTPAPAGPAAYVPASPPPTPAAEGATPGRPLGVLFDSPSSPLTGRTQPSRVPSARAYPAGPASRAQPAAAPATPVQAPAEAGGDTQDPPVNLLADEMSFDRENGIVTAKGNVEVTYGGRTLYTDRLAYNQNTQIVTAEGSVTIVEPTGETMFADQATITDDLRDGIIRNIGLILADRSRLAAHGAKRSGGIVTELRQGIYSPCNLCEEDPEAAPLWQIKAVRVIHDKRTKTVEYRDAWLEVYGIPVAYTPYFIHPDPTVRRKAGFLAPGFGGSSDLGFVVRTPYFYPIDETSDVTVTPMVMAEEGLLLSGDYRKRFKDGKLDVQLSGTQDSEGDTRGHIFAKGLFDLNRTWRAGFDINRSTDDTFLRRYGFDSPPVLESRVYAEGFRGRNYMVANAYSFQDLRAQTDAIDSPIVLPMFEYNHVGEPDRFGGNFTMDASFLAITRDDTGNDTRRVSFRPAWNRRFSDSFGNLFGFSTGVYADGYHVDDVARDNDTDFTGFAGRVHPYVSLDWRLPLINQIGTISQTLEPIVNVVASPNGGNPSKIPNEDSQEFEFDDTNLFEVNRFGGVDRVEGGTRVNYGLKWGLFGPKSGNMTLLVGQTYRVNPDDTFSDGSGLEDQFSDILAATQIRPNPYLRLGYRTQLDKDDLTPRRHQVSLDAGPPLLTTGVSYVFFEQPEDSEFTAREELSLGVSSQLSRTWRTRFQAVRDMEAQEMRSLSADLIYEDECLLVNTRFSRTFYSDRDLQPTDAFTVNLLLKTLGPLTF